MAKETEDRIWAQVSFFLTADPPAVGDFVTRSGVASVTRAALGVYNVVLDAGIATAEEALALCCEAVAKTNAAAIASVDKTGLTTYTIRTTDTNAPAAAVDVAVGFTVHRIRNTGTP